jgi:hypothetical protein
MKALMGTKIFSFLAMPWMCIIIGCSTSEWIEVNCPEEHVSTRLPRDPATTYRHYGTRYESGYRACESAFDSLIPSLRQTDTLKLIATNFREYLGGERSAVRTQFQSSVARLQDNPCDEEARKRFQYLIQYVNFNGHYLHKIAVACKDSSSNLRTLLEEYRHEKN